MRPDDIGEVIAERKLLMTTADGQVTTVTVRLGRPLPFPDDTGYYATFQVTGAGSEKVKYAGGIDAIQALQLAFKMVDAYLDALGEEQGCAFTLEGSDTGDHGFKE